MYPIKIEPKIKVRIITTREQMIPVKPKAQSLKNNSPRSFFDGYELFLFISALAKAYKPRGTSGLL